MSTNYKNHGSRIYSKAADLTAEQTTALEAARKARKAATGKDANSPEQIALANAIDALKFADITVRAALVKTARESILKRYGKRTDSLLRARKFDDSYIPGDKVVAVPSGYAVFITDDKPADEKLNSVMVWVSVNPVQMLSKDGRKAFMDNARGILKSAAHWYDSGATAEAGNQHFEAISAALKECYRLLGAGADVKPRFGGKASDVRAIAYAAKDVNRYGDSDTIRAGALSAKIVAIVCASIQYREARNADAERIAAEQLKAMRKEAEKNSDKPKKARKASGAVTKKAGRADGAVVKA